MSNSLMSKSLKYVNPEVLVSTQWVEDNLSNPKIKIVESNEDPLLYKAEHIPGAIEIDWTDDLNNPIVRDYLDKEHFEKLMSEKGIANDTTVIFYGDKSNWWACYAFWIFQLFGHKNAKIMNGGSLKWKSEGRKMNSDKVSYPKTNYIAKQDRDDFKLRALRDAVFEHIKNKENQLVDVRSPEEYSGERLHMPSYPNEGALRGGHIRGAKSIPWSRAVNEDGTFKSYDDLVKLYIDEQKLDPKKKTISYCRIGERSSHTWFVLTYLLGFESVRNYDGSWTEWGNLIGAPIEK